MSAQPVRPCSRCSARPATSARGVAVCAPCKATGKAERREAQRAAGRCACGGRVVEGLTRCEFCRTLERIKRWARTDARIAGGAR